MFLLASDVGRSHLYTSSALSFVPSNGSIRPHYVLLIIIWPVCRTANDANPDSVGLVYAVLFCASARLLDTPRELPLLHVPCCGSAHVILAAHFRSGTSNRACTWPCHRQINSRRKEGKGLTSHACTPAPTSHGEAALTQSPCPCALG